MSTLVPYPVVRLMCDVRYASAWFRVDGNRLVLTYGDSATGPVPDSLKTGIRSRKPEIIAALATIPPGCRLPTVHLLTGGCTGCTCGHNKSETKPIQKRYTTESEAA